MAAVLPDTDSEDELPPGWEERSTLDGSVYYVNHASKETQWTHPRTGKKKKVSGDLPSNWERTIDNGVVVFIDHSTDRRTYTDPRLAFATEEKEHTMDFRQRFDGTTTALQVLHGIDLSGKVFLVTGATSGIGFETAKSLASHGAEVILCGRSESTLKSTEMKITESNPTSKLRSIQMDLTCLNSVKHAVAVIKHHYKHIHVLILNAGVLALGYTKTVNGLETVFQVNHLAQFYLTLLLADRLHAGSRVVIVSSESHRFSNININNIGEEKLNPATPTGYWDMMVYNNSKLCNVLFGVELQRRWRDRGIDVFIVHPGNMVSTNLTKHSCFYRCLFAIVRPFTKSLVGKIAVVKDFGGLKSDVYAQISLQQQAAATSVYAAVASELAGSGGVYLNNCCPCEISKEGKDEALAKELWKISEGVLARTCPDLKSEEGFS